jgi:hypothetical protein
MDDRYHQVQTPINMIDSIDVIPTGRNTVHDRRCFYRDKSSQAQDRTRKCWCLYKEMFQGLGIFD